MSSTCSAIVVLTAKYLVCRCNRDRLLLTELEKENQTNYNNHFEAISAKTAHGLFLNDALTLPLKLCAWKWKCEHKIFCSRAQHSNNIYKIHLKCNCKRKDSFHIVLLRWILCSFSFLFIQCPATHIAWELQGVRCPFATHTFPFTQVTDHTIDASQRISE